MLHMRICMQMVRMCVDRLISLTSLIGECLDKVSGNGEHLPCNIGYEASTND